MGAKLPVRLNIPPAPTRTRRVTVIAQDPSVRKPNGDILTAQVEIPAEDVAPGPWGYRVQVIDYDTATGTLYKPREYKFDEHGDFVDPFRNARNDQLLNDPTFHSQNVYALAMRVLTRFELALGRRIGWSFQGHQLKISPHAFADANAFYSSRDEALMFGYFPGAKGTVFSCLSHDVVAHECAHGVLDGLRERYQDASSPDQAGFHEGFADVVALLSVFSLSDVVEFALRSGTPDNAWRSVRGTKRPLVARTALTPKALRRNLLFGLAEEMGQEMSQVRGQALRRSVDLVPSTSYYNDPEFDEPHRRGEILVAAVLNAFLEVLGDRFAQLGEVEGGYLDLGRVVEDAAEAADYLLTMAIRAIDYAMPVHMLFTDYLCAVLTADHEVHPVDKKFKFRQHLLKSFIAYGMQPTSQGREERGLWMPPENPEKLKYDRTHFEPMQRDPDEVFRFIWENRQQLRVADGAYTRVLSVRPCLRVNPFDGFTLRETVAEYMQQVTIRGDELKRYGLQKPRDLPNDAEVTLYGGGTLIFDEYARLKFNINNRLDDTVRQQRRIDDLAKYGMLGHGASAATAARRFAQIHRRRALNARTRAGDQWL